jgi:nucleoside-diphosphate-sugar epimerase
LTRVLVTGVSGSIGSKISNYLFKQGFSVSGTYRTNRPNVLFPLYNMDLSAHCFCNESFDVIIHTAGERPKRKGESPEYMHQSIEVFKKNNIDSMYNLIRFAKDSKVKKIIYLSSIGVYGQIREGLINEESDCINQDAYGLTKYMAELLLKEVESINSITLRLPGVVGDGCDGVWLTNMINKLKNGEDVVVYSPEFKTSNFVWIDDLTLFVDKLLRTDYWKYDTLCLGCYKPVAIKEIVDFAKGELKSESKIIIRENGRKPFRIVPDKAFEMGYESLSPIEITHKYIETLFE